MRYVPGAVPVTWVVTALDTAARLAAVRALREALDLLALVLELVLAAVALAVAVVPAAAAVVVVAAAAGVPVPTSKLWPSLRASSISRAFRHYVGY